MKAQSPLAEIQDKMCVAFAVMMLAILTFITCCGCGWHAWCGGRWWDVGWCVVIAGLAVVAGWQMFRRFDRLGNEEMWLRMQPED